MIKLEIAGILIEVIPDDIEIPPTNKYLLDEFKTFISDYKERSDIRVIFNSCRNINRPEGKILLDVDIKWVSKTGVKNTFCCFACCQESGKVIAVAEANDDWSHISVSWLKDASDSQIVDAVSLFEVLFRNSIIHRQGISIHASAIEWESKGIVFSAPAGTGKTTQAHLWNKNMNAEILNGDRPTVRVLNGKPYVFGTPWSGSSQEYINSRAPLSALVVLEQSDFNTIKQLSKHEALLRLMPRCFLPYQDEMLMNLAINNIKEIILNTPVYLLKCRPDREALEILHECIK